MNGEEKSINSRIKGRVLFAGQAYYHPWYLSRELRKMGWQADVLNWDAQPSNNLFYHGEDFLFDYEHPDASKAQIEFYFWALNHYDVFHFSNQHRMTFGPLVQKYFRSKGFPASRELELIKEKGKKIVYSNNGCNDGVLRSSFERWNQPESLCALCRFNNDPATCSDQENQTWAIKRNNFADYQINLGGNRQDFNNFHTVHEVPEFYNMSEELWRPDLEIPEEHNLHLPKDAFKIYHAVGNFESRTTEGNRNIKSTHIWLAVIERLKQEGFKVELIFCHDKPSNIVRYYQAQADIVGEMLSYGFFGSTGREGLMLGKPVVCYLRTEWLKGLSEEIPDYHRDLPIVHADPSSVYDVVVDLIRNPEKRLAIGRKSREFGLRFHSAKAAAIKMDQIYSGLIGIQPGPANDEISFPMALQYAEAHLQTGRIEQAKIFFKQALKIVPHAHAAIKGLAQVHYQLGEIIEAADLLSTLPEQDQDSLLLGAQCAEISDDRPNSYKLYQAVLSLEPTNPRALAGEKRNRPIYNER